MKLEQTILKNLIYNEEYLRKVLPFLKWALHLACLDQGFLWWLSFHCRQAVCTTPWVEPHYLPGLNSDL
jgi:hypothetical protein